MIIFWERRGGRKKKEDLSCQHRNAFENNIAKTMSQWPASQV
jgi:hypothetical protein